MTPERREKAFIQIKEYAYALGRITKPTNIRFISRISNNRVCVFFASKEMFFADHITDTYKHIRINNYDLRMRPLITKYQRIILSNVYPTIPHSIIQEVLDKLNIKRESAVSFLRADIPEEGFAHVLSFRRQVYVHPEDLNKFLNSIKIDYDQTTYWIYLSMDSLKCFICKQEGHVVKPKSENQTTPADQGSKTVQTWNLIIK